MPYQRVIGSYLLRFVKARQQPYIYLQNLKTGEQLEFETWTSAYCFLEEKLANPNDKNLLEPES